MGGVLRPLGLGATALMRPVISRPDGPRGRGNARSVAPLRRLRRVALRLTRGRVGALPGGSRAAAGSRAVAARPRRSNGPSCRSVLSGTRLHRGGWLRGSRVAAFVESATAVVAPSALWRPSLGRLFRFGRSAGVTQRPAPCAFACLGIAAAAPSRGRSLPRCSGRGTLSRTAGSGSPAVLGGDLRRGLGRRGGLALSRTDGTWAAACRSPGGSRPGGRSGFGLLSRIARGILFPRLRGGRQGCAGPISLR